MQQARLRQYDGVLTHGRRRDPSEEVGMITGRGATHATADCFVSLTVAVGASVSASVSLQRVRATHSPLPRSRYSASPSSQGSGHPAPSHSLTHAPRVAHHVCPEEPTQPCSSASAPSSDELLSETDESSCAAVGARASSSSARLGRIVKQQLPKPEGGVCRRGWLVGCCAAVAGLRRAEESPSGAPRLLVVQLHR